MGGYRSTMPESNCTIGAMTYRIQGHGGHRTGTGRLHLAKADPWRQAVAAIFGDEHAVIDDLHWEYPDDIQEDDIVLTVVDVVGQWDGDPGVADAAVPVVVELGTVVQLGDDLDVEADAIFADGVSVAAIARRLGEAPPASPARTSILNSLGSSRATPEDMIGRGSISRLRVWLLIPWFWCRLIRVAVRTSPCRGSPRSSPSKSSSWWYEPSQVHSSRPDAPTFGRAYVGAS